MTMFNKADITIFKKVSMGGRFGKYGDVRSKAQFWKNGSEKKMFKELCTFCRTALLAPP